MVLQPSNEKPAPFEPDARMLVPRIKHANFLVGMKESGVPEEQWPHTEPLAGDLLVTYAFDVPEMFLMVMPDHLKALGLAPGQLRELALSNMRRQIPQIQTEELRSAIGARVFHVMTGNGFDACVLLATRFWQNLVQHIPGRPVIAVPNREVVLVCSDESVESMALMKQIATKAFEEGGNHALTKKLLTWKDGVLAEYAA